MTDASNDAIRKSMGILRRDAFERGMGSLALVYSWSEIVAGCETIKDAAARLSGRKTA